MFLDLMGRKKPEKYAVDKRDECENNGMRAVLI